MPVWGSQSFHTLSDSWFADQRACLLSHVSSNEKNRHTGRQGTNLMLEATKALLLRKTKLSDTSLIVSWLTETHGRIKTVAKGARRPKSPFAGKLDLFFEAEIQYVRSRRGDLHTLREVASHNTNESLRLNLKTLEAASYFVELIELVTEPEHPTADLYDLMLRAIHFLDGKSVTERAILHFESELVRALGIQDEDRRSSAESLIHTYGRLPLARRGLLENLSRS